MGHILRLNTDGSLDTSFQGGTSANGTVYSLSMTSGGQILVGGQFTQFNGHTTNDMLMLNSDGSYDNTFTDDTISRRVLESIICSVWMLTILLLEVESNNL